MIKLQPHWTLYWLSYNSKDHVNGIDWITTVLRTVIHVIPMVYQRDIHDLVQMYWYRDESDRVFSCIK